MTNSAMGERQMLPWQTNMMRWGDMETSLYAVQRTSVPSDTRPIRLLHGIVSTIP